MNPLQSESLALARMVRRCCTECGSEDLKWSAARYLEDGFGADLLAQVVRSSGGLLTMEQALDGHVWVCLSCMEFGVFA